MIARKPQGSQPRKGSQPCNKVKQDSGAAVSTKVEEREIRFSVSEKGNLIFQKNLSRESSPTNARNLILLLAGVTLTGVGTLSGFIRSNLPCTGQQSRGETRPVCRPGRKAL